MRRRLNDERGFALIGTVWLLLLSAALVAILALRARTVAVAASQEGTALQREIDLDSATQTVAAELLIEGPHSRWWQLPARGAVMLGNHTVNVSISSEEGRIDLNETDPAAIQDALQGLGYAANDVQAFLTALLTRRQAGRISSSGEVQRLIAPLERSGNRCLQDFVTVDSGLARPDATRAPMALARSLGVGESSGSTQLRLGEALRIKVAAQSGARRIAVERVGVVGASPIAVSRSWIPAGCTG